MSHRLTVTLAVVAGLTAFVAGQAPPASSAGDWPQWRGPDRTGLSRETLYAQAVELKGGRS